MVWKGLLSKIGRFVRGRIASFRTRGAGGEIPSTCLHVYAPSQDAVGEAANRLLVVFYSGDGGWANLTTSLAERWQRAGIGVVGIDCMHYFWQEKDPGLAANQLSAAIDQYSEQWETANVVLVGYSMGADVLPSIARRLAASVNSRVVRMILISPGHWGVLRFRFIGWLGISAPDGEGQELLPDLVALVTSFPIVCYAGEKEHDSLACSLSADIGVVKFLPGGHHFGGDYTTLAESVLAEILDES